MSRQASPAVVGGFVIGAITLVLIGVLSFGGGRFLSEKHTFVLYFEGSLNGLTVGSPVLFKGVKVGRVSDLLVRYDARNGEVTTPVYVELDNRIESVGGEKNITETITQLIHNGLRAELVLQSLITGQLAIQLDTKQDTEERLLGIEPRYQEIPTVRSAMEQVLNKLERLPVEEMIAEFRSLVRGIDGFIRSDELKLAISRLDVVLANADELVLHIDAKIDPLSDSVIAAADEGRAALKQVRESLVKLEDRMDAALRDYQHLAATIDGEVGPLSKQFQSTLAELREATKQARTTLDTLDRTVAEDSPLQFRLNTALDEIAAAARSMRDLADYVERHPESLLRGKAGDGE